jgi:prepilin-type N-terminal cleavage/methylation domain-containing protein
MQRLRQLRLSGPAGEGGFTLVELLVASAMSVVLLGAISSMVISTMRIQPKISKSAQNVSSGRWVLDRMTRELRNGIRVDQATASKLSLLTYVRHSTCGSTTLPSATTPSIKCEVTYQCSTTACTRTEAADGVYTGTARTLFTGINSSSVFCYVPSTEPDPLTCGTAKAASGVTFVRIRLQVPDPSGSGSLTVSDGASLRNATLLK